LLLKLFYWVGSGQTVDFAVNARGKKRSSLLILNITDDKKSLETPNQGRDMDGTGANEIKLFTL